MLEDSEKESPISAGLAPRERRAHPRYPFSPGAEVIDVSSGARLSARISDIGRGGCYADSISPFVLGRNVKLSITKDTDSFVALAKVVFSSGGMGMGLMFTSIETEQRWTLEKWLSELRGELVTKPETPKGPRDTGIPGILDTTKTADSEQSYVLNELIVALMRKRVLTDAEGKTLLQKLLS